MSGTQFYNTTAIKNKAEEIKTQNAELKKIIAEMEGIVNEISRVWQDCAQTKFVQQFNEMQPELDSFCKNIASYAERAENHAIAVEKDSTVI